MKLILTKDYLLLIDKEAEIKEASYRLHIHEKTLNHPIHMLEHGENTFDSWKLVLAYYPLIKEAKELDLPLLPNPFERIGGVIHWINKRLSDFTNNPQHIGDNEYNSILIIKRMLEAQSKQFSLEDVRRAFHVGRLYQGREWDTTLENLIQSLITQQLPKEFIPEYEKEHDDTVPFPKLRDSRIIKTTTNSEGKQELVGVYIY